MSTCTTKISGYICPNILKGVGELSYNKPGLSTDIMGIGIDMTDMISMTSTIDMTMTDRIMLGKSRVAPITITQTTTTIKDQKEITFEYFQPD